MRLGKKEKKLQKKLQKQILKKISKDIGNMRPNGRNGKAIKTIHKIENYYNSNNYKEDILFYRMDKLEKNKLSLDTIYTLPIGLFLGLAFDKILQQEKTILASITLIIAFVATLLYMKYSASPENGRDEYFVKKEIEIISNIIESSNKNNKKRTK